MGHTRRLQLLSVAALLACATAAFAYQPQQPDREHQKIVFAYRTWLEQQPRDVQRAADVVDRYGAKLQADGVPAEEIARRLQIVREGQKRTVEIWNEALTAERPTFNTNPNAFLVEVTKGRKPGRALDVGMGQGRNAIYLAQQGWEVTGFDPADKAVAAALATAKKLGVTLTTSVSTVEAFDFGKEQWDLIVFTYVPVRGAVDAVIESLRPGGLVVVEGFHRDIFRGDPSRPGGNVLFTDNELVTLFGRLRIRQYEDAETAADYGMRRQRGEKTPIVRLAAQKR